jgi:hypothetical protein
MIIGKLEVIIKINELPTKLLKFCQLLKPSCKNISMSPYNEWGSAAVVY